MNMDKPKTPTQQSTKVLSTDYFNGKVPYGFISRKEIDWIKSERSLIGKGTYGRVYRYDTPYGLVVVKLIKHNFDIKENYIREISLLRSIEHPNVITLLDVFFTKEEIGIVLPLRSTTLDRILQDNYLKLSKSRKIDLTPIIIDSIIYQIIQGMIAIQDNNILHGDYKLDNVLVFPSSSKDCIRIEITDFGLANVDECFQKPFEWELFILSYRPPELGLYREHLDEGYDTRPTFPLYTRKGDSWVLGCMIYHILTGKYLFDPEHDEDTSFYRETSSMKVEDFTEEETELTKLMKQWIDYDNLNSKEDSKLDKELLTKLEGELPEKYAGIVFGLLRFYPQEREDIRDVANFRIFDEVRNLCVPKNKKSIPIKRNNDTVAYCLEFLTTVQFSIGDRVEFTNRKTRVILMEICRELVDTFGFEMDLSGRVNALTVEFLDVFADRNIREGGKEWNQGKNISYICGAFLVAVAFYGEVLIETEEIVKFIQQSNSETIFSCALQIFASLDFKLVKSTTYDLIRINSSEYNDKVVEVAYWILSLSYMTNIYRQYSCEKICFGIYHISSILNNKRVNNVSNDAEVGRYLLKEIKETSKYIDIQHLEKLSIWDSTKLWSTLLSLNI